jgi:hypothetical protein
MPPRGLAVTVGNMFVAANLTVGIGLRAAQARFANLVHGTWLAEVSETSYNQGITGLLRVGPPGPAAAKLVRVSFLDPVYRGEVMTVGLRWEATGAAGGLFPVLDANISFCPAEETNTAEGKESARLALAGTYRPPLGHLGAALDKAILHRAATATIRALLRSVADAVTSPAPQHSAKGMGPSLRLAPGAGDALGGGP